MKSDRITGTVHEDQCKFVIISRSVLLRIKMFQTNIAEKIKTQFYIQYFFCRKSWPLWYNVEKYRTARQATDDSTILLMLVVCWITKATNTQSQDVISIAFPLQQWLYESASVLRYSTYIAYLVNILILIRSIFYVDYFSSVHFSDASTEQPLYFVL